MPRLSNAPSLLRHVRRQQKRRLERERYRAQMARHLRLYYAARDQLHGDVDLADVRRDCRAGSRSLSAMKRALQARLLAYIDLVRVAARLDNVDRLLTVIGKHSRYELQLLFAVLAGTVALASAAARPYAADGDLMLVEVARAFLDEALQIVALHYLYSNGHEEEELSLLRKIGNEVSANLLAQFGPKTDEDDERAPIAPLENAVDRVVEEVRKWNDVTDPPERQALLCRLLENLHVTMDAVATTAERYYSDDAEQTSCATLAARVDVMDVRSDSDTNDGPRLAVFSDLEDEAAGIGNSETEDDSAGVGAGQKKRRRLTVRMPFKRRGKKS